MENKKFKIKKELKGNDWYKNSPPLKKIKWSLKERIINYFKKPWTCKRICEIILLIGIVCFFLFPQLLVEKIVCEEKIIYILKGGIC